MDNIRDSQIYFRKYIEEKYEKEVAQVETAFLNKETNMVNLAEEKFLYGGDEVLKNKHDIYLKYINSSHAKYIASLIIISNYYVKKPCTVTSIVFDSGYTRSSIAEIVKQCVDAGWLYTEKNKNKNTETLILPTFLRLQFWKIFCKTRFLLHESLDIGSTHQMLKAYHGMKPD